MNHPSYHARLCTVVAVRSPAGAPVTTPRHPAFCSTNFLRPGQTAAVRQPSVRRIPPRALEPEVVQALGGARSCETVFYRCSALRDGKPKRCSLYTAILGSKLGRAQRCEWCRARCATAAE